MFNSNFNYNNDYNKQEIRYDNEDMVNVNNRKLKRSDEKNPFIRNLTKNYFKNNRRNRKYLTNRRMRKLRKRYLRIC